ncbi:hypothetical protein ACQ7CY_24790 [Chryseobacterium arthrosphaerae]|uniref:hypothetical protein n=1 Tax=Chryseobacterium arthrosphaerae TaxID=651561 RepID=UPI003D327439
MRDNCGSSFYIILVFGYVKTGLECLRHDKRSGYTLRVVIGVFKLGLKPMEFILFDENGLKPIPIEYCMPYYLLLITTSPPLALIETVTPQHRQESCRIDTWKRKA